MNHIKNIEIKNFKSIRQAQVEDCRRVNVFIGYPNVGKSNILEALGGFSILNWANGDNENLKSLFRFERFSDIFYNGNTKESSFVRTNYHSTCVITLLESKRLTFMINDGGDEERKQGIKTFITAINDNGKFLLIEREGEPEIVKQPLKKYLFKQNVKYESSKSLSLNVPFGENLNDVVETHPELRKEFNEILKEYNLNLHFDRTNGNNILELRKTLPDDTTITIDWNLMADTLQRLFFYKAAISSNKNSVLLFEEPEAHMFPPYISTLTSDIINDSKSNQYFIATHSPFVLNDIMEDLDKSEYSIYAVGYKTDTGETIIRKITDEEIDDIYQYGIDLFFNLENYLKDVV